MRKLICKIGQKFSYWTVTNNNLPSKHGHSFVEVQCKCGTIQQTSLADLSNGRTTGCRNCKARERSRKIKIGDKFKEWTVIGGYRVTKQNIVQWLVECSCGNYQRWIQSNELVNPDKCFKCRKCSAKTTQRKITKKNGRIGELKKTQYTRLQKSAEIRSIEWNITLEELWDLFISQKQICAITGDFIPDIKKASLDRINSSLGYISNNIQWVTIQANLSKHTMTMNELYQFCNKVLNHAN